MLWLINSGQARLYPGVLKMLDELKANGHTLVFLSNCKHSYMAAHCKYFALDKYFSAFYCTEDFSWMPKHEIFDVIQNKFYKEFIIIGDRFQDMEIAQKHGLRSIGCIYGYGSAEELSGANVIVHIPTEIYLHC